MNDIVKYQKMIRSMFPVYGAYERRFYKDLKQVIAEYTETEKDISFSDLERKFGTPANVIQDYLDSVDTDYLARQLTRAKNIRIACACTVLGILCAVSVYMAALHTAYGIFADDMPASKETIIEIHNGGNEK